MPRRPIRGSSRSARVLPWLGVAVLLAIAFGYVQPLRSYLGGREELAAHRAELSDLLRRQSALRARLEHSRTDAFVEREARRLGLVRTGERLYIVKGVEKPKRARVR